MKFYLLILVAVLIIGCKKKNQNNSAVIINKDTSFSQNINRRDSQFVNEGEYSLKLIKIRRDTIREFVKINLVDTLSYGNFDSTLKFYSSQYSRLRCFKDYYLIVTNGEYELGEKIEVFSRVNPSLQDTIKIFPNDTPLYVTTSDAEYLFGVKDNYLFLDFGTAPPPRGLLVYDLKQMKVIYSAGYYTIYKVDNNCNMYFQAISDIEATELNHPRYKEIIESGNTPVILEDFVINLKTKVLKKLGNKVCSSTQ